VLFHSESYGDVYSAVVIEEFGDGRGHLTAEGARAFSAEVERWITEVHRKNPVAFFVGPSRSIDDGGWNGWSYAQLGTVVLPWLERYLDSHQVPLQVEDTEDANDPEADPAAETLDDVPRSTPMDLTTLRSLVSDLEAVGTPVETTWTAALAARIKDALALAPR
jgi:hypothetical protein